ncbi:MAG TPA: hydroxymethylglutaryl-CoA reductase, degradative [Flavobacteriaceae bacterium]|nr:hydroxymethylglutaryl-CoA reductase, degradative [Flavobacteriaceae bacterium]HQU22140.1 hydroxymethylglutaryl-CoA reductase, degradative [Flavobacteriaceae bacterium]HQU64298.1 hydroxymethylglutaryl-CoA reductase, degradative [Flavobacteriaceae bacterium]HRW44309.1 hydroxymethylglutaryl-CoA reductase, degradative [Flavobacteriaceae bacterium]
MRFKGTFMKVKAVSGFSKKSKAEKVTWIVHHFLNDNPKLKAILEQYWNPDPTVQKLHDDFTENTLTNFYLPFGIAPNFLINGDLLAVPMVIEESSVVAAASNAAKFWMDRGGFQAEVISTEKNGQVHINFKGTPESLIRYFEAIKPKLLERIDPIQKNMKKRGGGLKELVLIDGTKKLDGYYQLHASFETLDAMGANFINSCLEQIAQAFENEAIDHEVFQKEGIFPEVVMSILSNYVPECLVKAWVECPVDALANNGMDGQAFAENFLRAVEIAKIEPRRAVTHNKGIMNGIDAVVLATGNDFRAVEAGIHAYASRNGSYSSLTEASIQNDLFTFKIEIPMALGTVGGLTSLHPLVQVAHAILQNPNAMELMKITAVVGLAQNFAALRSLITTGIQKGHMKMHLMNILNQLQASESEKQKTIQHFKDRVISHSQVVKFIETLRN